MLKSFFLFCACVGTISLVGVANSACYDSDGTFSIVPQLYFPGICIDKNGIYKDSCSDKFITEYVCENNKCTPKQNLCLFGGPKGIACYTDNENKGFCWNGLTCSDTDGGKNILVAGSCDLKIILDLSLYTQNDYCINDQQIIERYCAFYPEAEISLCNSELSICPPDHVCKNGQCVGPCEDKDGENEFQKEKCNDASGEKWDFCTDPSIVGEYICQQNKCYLKNISCPAGYICDDGACKKGCKDTDNGIDIFNFGMCSDATNPQGYGDKCTGPSTFGLYTMVKEYYCESQSCKFIEINCPPGYACEEMENSPRCVLRASCSDSDGGKNIWEGGICSQSFLTQSKSFRDWCVDERNLNEYFCSLEGAAPAIYYACQGEVVPCPEDATCVSRDGSSYCVKKDCQDSDGGENKFLKGVCQDYSGSYYTDSCASDTMVYEYVCQNNKCEVKRLNCGEGYRCHDGACKKSRCVDEDGGANPYVKARCFVQIEETGEIIIGGWDSCKNERTVNEMVCVADGGFGVQEITCKEDEKCEDGRCVVRESPPPPPPLCQDQDGEDISKKGTCTDSGGLKTDYCVNKSTVGEYVCKDSTCSVKELNCQEGWECEDGACQQIISICEDSDGGKNFLTRGECKDSNNQFYEDFCVNENTVKEYFCDGEKCNSEDIPCGQKSRCVDGQCIPEGICDKLVPCTLQTCTLCDFFKMFQRIINCILFGIVPPLAVFMVVVGGALYIGAVFEFLPGGMETVSRAKRLFTSVVIGLLIVYGSWLIINLFLVVMGYTSPTGRWWEIECRV